VKRGRVACGLLAVALSLGLAAGCGVTKKLSGTAHANAAPNTVLFVDGPVDTVNHIVHLYWFGTDSDGHVAGFEWRLFNPVAPADTNWRFTPRTDSIFTVLAPDGYTNTMFTVRAVDDAGARDPDPPLQALEFSNQAATVRLLQKPLPTDTTFATVSVTWIATDPDGDFAKLIYLVWLDGNEDTPQVTSQLAITMPSDQFLVDGSFTPGPRTLYVRAIDDGGRAGPPDSVRWNVRGAPPNPRLLIVDEVSRNTNSPPVNLRFDTLYSNSVARVGLTADDYTILRLDSSQPFRTAKDVEQTFKLFQNVVWYRGQERTSSPVLALAEQGISAYLDAGGQFYLDGLYLIAGVGATGSLSEDFVRRHLGSSGMISASVITQAYTGISIGFGNTGTSVFLPHVPVNGSVGRDSMYVRRVFDVIPPPDPFQTGGLRHFEFLDREQVVLWGAPGTLTPASGDSTAVGISVPQPSGGRAIVVCTAPGSSQPPVGAGTTSGSAARFITNIYRHLGLDQPFTGRTLARR